MGSFSVAAISGHSKRSINVVRFVSDFPTLMGSIHMLTTDVSHFPRFPFQDFPVRRNAFCFSATIAACAKGAQWQQAAELLLRHLGQLGLQKSKGCGSEWAPRP